MTFEKWMAVVDAWITARLGLSSADLPDCLYRNWYDDGVSPQSAAARAIKNTDE